MKKTFLLFSLHFVVSSFGYSNEDVSNANYLVEQNIITQQTTSSEYRLDDQILRQEAIGIALKLKEIALPENHFCAGIFADVTKDDWVCRAVEIAVDNGIISRANEYANPGKYVTRSEALAMITNGKIQDLNGLQMPSPYAWRDASVEWQKNLLYKMDSLKIIPFPEDPLLGGRGAPWGNWYPDRPATRAEVFGFARKVLDDISTRDFQLLQTTERTTLTYKNATASLWEHTITPTNPFIDNEGCSILNVYYNEYPQPLGEDWAITRERAWKSLSDTQKQLCWKENYAKSTHIKHHYLPGYYLIYKVHYEGATFWLYDSTENRFIKLPPSSSGVKNILKNKTGDETSYIIVVQSPYAPGDTVWHVDIKGSIRKIWSSNDQENSTLIQAISISSKNSNTLAITIIKEGEEGVGKTITVEM